MRLTSADLIADPIGNYPAATVACFDATHGELPRRRLDDATNVRFLERLSSVGAPAVLIAASTGHGHVRTVDELRHWLWVATTAKLRRTVPMALLRPEDGADANRGLVRDLREWGYPVVFIRPGTNLSREATDAEVVANMRPLVEAAASERLAVGVYSIPDVSGVRLTPHAAADLVRGPGGSNIVAIKVTEADYDISTLRFLEHPGLRHLKIVQGWDPHLSRALQDGPSYDPQRRQRCGVTSGPMSFAIYQYLHLLEAARQQDWSEVAESQLAVTTLFQAMQDDPAKFADLQRAKYVMGLGQPLTGAVTKAQVERLLTALVELPRESDRFRLARSLDLLGDGPFHDRLAALSHADAYTTVAALREQMARFVADRDWRQFHSPKNVSMALAVEAAELMEHFQWITAEASRRLREQPGEWQAVREELADVIGYGLAMANELDIDVSAAIHDKMAQNRSKYPADKFRGRFE
jgi:NTP pyrophosphatase (non-canonical NTP hydrolase)/dihydrodipicolinate synthase/N-acetylneuraminate lyase